MDYTPWELFHKLTKNLRSYHPSCTFYYFFDSGKGGALEKAGKF